MNAYSIGATDSNGEDGRRLVVLDMPGYGKGAKAEWGTEIIKYLEKRKQLRRAFVLIDTEHGIKPTDRQMLSIFREKEIPHQVVLAKVDKILFPNTKVPSEHALKMRFERLQDIMFELQRSLGADEDDVAGLFGEVVACSAERKVGGKKLGIDGVRFAILRAAGMALERSSETASGDEIVPYDELVWND